MVSLLFRVLYALNHFTGIAQSCPLLQLFLPGQALPATFLFTAGIETIPVTGIRKEGRDPTIPLPLGHDPGGYVVPMHFCFCGVFVDRGPGTEIKTTGPCAQQSP